MRRIVVATVLLALAVASPAAAQEDPRVRTDAAGDFPFKVLLPSDYDRSDRRYPVLYLIHPGGVTDNHWLDRTDLREFSEGRDVIVVLPNQQLLSFYVDAREPACPRLETAFMGELIPHVDAHYRTIADGRHRAIAGIAPGGLSAFHLAARHPDAFVAAGTFSGEPDVTYGYDAPGYPFYWATISAFATVRCGGNPAGPGLFGSPVDDEVWWRNANPPDLAGNLRGLLPYLSVGNGIPCDAEDVAGLAEEQEGEGTQAFQFTEPVVEMGTKGLARALDREQVPYEENMDRCGVHTWRYWERDLHDFWPRMEAAFGTAAPAEFDYRRADPEFSVWGWRFAADPDRAPEFLEIEDASRAGLTLTGSGTETVTTAPYFQPGQRVRTGGEALEADGGGRLTLSVDLGPPHDMQQYRPGAPGPDAFMTRRVDLDPWPALRLGAPLRGRPLRVPVEALDGSVRGVQLLLRAPRGRVLGRSRPFTAGPRRRVVRIPLAAPLRPGHYELVATGRADDGSRVRAAVDVRLPR